MSRSRVRLHYTNPAAAPEPASMSLLDDDDLQADQPIPRPAADQSDDESFSDEEMPPQVSRARIPTPQPPAQGLRMDPRLLNVMDSGQLMPEVKDSLVEEQIQFGNTVSQHDSDFARRWSSRNANSAPEPLSGRPTDEDDGDDGYDDEEDGDEEDDDYNHGDRYRTVDDGYSSAPAQPAASYTQPAARPKGVDKEALLRKQLRVDYRLLHQSGVVSTKNYNINTTPLELLVDDLEDLHVDDRIQQWTGIVKDIVVYMAQFMEFVNYRFLNSRFALEGYGRFMEARIPLLRPKIVRVAGMLVKSGATINPVFDLLLAFVGQTIMYIGLNKVRGQFAALPAPSSTPFSTQQSFNSLERDVPQQQEYQQQTGTGSSQQQQNQRPGVKFFEGDRPMYNGNVAPLPEGGAVEQPQQQPLNANAPENPFVKMMSGENNNFLMNIFNAVAGGGGMGPAGGGLGPEFKQEISSMLPNQGNYNSFEEAMRQGEQEMQASEPKVVAPNIFMTHETSSRRKRNGLSMLN